MDNTEQQSVQPTADDEAQVSPVEEHVQPEPEDLEQGDILETIATQIGEEKSHLKKQVDMGATLKRMQEGVIITLHISRPRFWMRIDLAALGLDAISEEAQSVITSYFRLGKRSLLPPDLQKRMQQVEANARFNLQRYSFKSHWGAFVPTTAYKAWKDRDDALKQEFLDLRDELLNNYQDIMDQVVEDARSLAEDAWKRVAVGTALNQENGLDILTDVIERLRAGQGKETFVENYLDVIRVALPIKDVVEAAFSYEVERSVIPLPSLVAKDMEAADRVYQGRALEDARTRAQLDVIEAERRSEIQKLNLQQQQEQEIEYQRLWREQERQRLQWEMERDVLADARRQKEALVKEFYTTVVAQINTLIHEATTNVLESLEKTDGVLIGRTSMQLKKLIEQLKNLHFVDDQQIEDQLKRLSDVVPTEAQTKAASTGKEKINTPANIARIREVIRAIHQETEQVQVDLATQPHARHRRNAPIVAPISLDAARRKARGTEDVEQAPEMQGERRRRRTL